MSFSLHGFSVHVPCQTHSFSQPSSILSPQNYLFNVLNSPFCPLLFTLSAFISGRLFFKLLFPRSRWSFPFLLLLSCAQSFWTMLPLLCTSLWKARRSGLSPPVGGRGTVRGYQYTNTKQYPVVHPPFCFLQWEASSTKDIQWFWGPERSFDRAGTKLTDVIPIWNNCEHLQCWNK